MSQKLSTSQKIEESLTSIPSDVKFEKIIVDRTLQISNNRSFVPKYYSRIIGVANDGNTIYLWGGESENETLLREKSRSKGKELSEKYGCVLHILRD